MVYKLLFCSKIRSLLICSSFALSLNLRFVEVQVVNFFICGQGREESFAQSKGGQTSDNCNCGTNVEQLFLTNQRRNNTSPEVEVS